jgi:tetrahydromethanopterin S-methyltransferase subunit G
VLNVPKVWVNPAQIAKALKRAERALAPDVVLIRFTLRDDWTGEPSIFFKIVLSDKAASKQSKLNEITERIEFTIREKVKPDELGLNSYFNFRSLSEHNELNDPAWA